MGLKAVAVPYIIAIILGIVVVGVIGWWFFSVAGQGAGQSLGLEKGIESVKHAVNPQSQSGSGGSSGTGGSSSSSQTQLRQVNALQGGLVIP